MNAELLTHNQTESLTRRVWLLIKTPIVLGLLITPIRFSLEMSGLPDGAIFLFGALWLTLGLSIYWGIRLYRRNQAHLTLLLCLTIFSPISRIPIALLWYIDNKLEIGSHYGLYFHNFQSAILNQIGYGSLIQIIPGFIIGTITIAIMKHWHL
ncbi:hypothetical protein [Ekhidna sp.]|uniref:hypothetical protein n=1 Tax=Ekhidna sp. TaxID=2608089 RepID=UPI003CCC437E